jgi:hypothetical protein
MGSLRKERVKAAPCDARGDERRKTGLSHMVQVICSERSFWERVPATDMVARERSRGSKR